MKSKRFLYLIAPSILAVSVLAGCAGNDPVFTEKTVNAYYGDSKSINKQKLYFSESYPGIPFINIQDGLSLIEQIARMDDGDKGFKLTGEANDNKYTVKRENGASVVFDFSKKTASIDNTTKFRQGSFADNSFDFRGFNGNFYDEQGKIIENQIRVNQVRNKGSNPETKGISTYIPLSMYDIPLYKTGDKYMLPFTTYYNILGIGTVAALFNGESIFVTNTSLDNQTKDDSGKTLKDIYYSFKPQARSKELKEYAYNEFIRELDCTYGLQDTHKISSFAELFVSNGLKDQFLSDDPIEYRKALYALQRYYLGDFHTGLTFCTPYFEFLDKTKESEIAKSSPTSIQYKASFEAMLKRSSYKVEHNVSQGDSQTRDTVITNPYMENGDIALVTFDSFRLNDNVDFYYTDEFKNNKQKYIQSDTLALISYANDRIKANSNIKKVIIDLSGNGGGQADAALFVLGWLNSGMVQAENPLDGSKGSVEYISDINFDKKYVDSSSTGIQTDILNETNSLGESKYQVFCLTSGDSFSCGNYVPCMLKQTGAATLVGTTTGGGACTVHVSGTADGTGFRMSSSYRLCSIKNGTYYHIDKGVEPDIYLNDFETLYAGTIDPKTQKDSGDRNNLFKYFSYL